MISPSQFKQSLVLLLINHISSSIVNVTTAGNNKQNQEEVSPIVNIRLLNQMAANEHGPYFAYTAGDSTDLQKMDDAGRAS